MNDEQADTTGAHSGTDNAPQPSPAAISSAALAAQLQEFSTAPTDGPRFNGGVDSQTVAPIGPGFPEINFHVGGWGYDIPMGR